MASSPDTSQGRASVIYDDSCSGCVCSDGTALQVLERANKSEYGLAAGIWAKGGWHPGHLVAAN